eukprot:CAMPEP_0174987134 /NCGR_PEP_ID=MMETSP0004_2-20121128/19362_1 /TAXON_ID=420556 /ORGANISM="Ochromonas sp., Strain CCMP1393" /LENGTH=61 /DNA_ID=CAMNT_0016240127 /DNA_START=258 /DNA_END=443 /DNA_ORIENTATION=+
MGLQEERVRGQQGDGDEGFGHAPQSLGLEQEMTKHGVQREGSHLLAMWSELRALRTAQQCM